VWCPDCGSASIAAHFASPQDVGVIETKDFAAFEPSYDLAAGLQIRMVAIWIVELLDAVKSR
jgi:hypothetical protein